MVQRQSPLCRRDIDVVAFDFDGTLADTVHAIEATVQATLASLGLPSIERHQLQPLIGVPLRDAFLGLGVADLQLATCITRYRELFSASAHTVALFPGTLDCLLELRRLGLELAVVSSRGRSSLGLLLERLEVTGYFDLVLGDEDAANKKPAPDLVLATAAHFGVAPQRILVVGDTTYDIEMGHAAGARTCAVTYGNHDEARLGTARPHHSTSCLWPLAGWLTP